MRSLLLLFTLFHLTAGVCPPVLEKVDMRMITLSKPMREAVDTACGRRQFTTAFWSLDLLKEYAVMAARSSIRHTTYICDEQCAAKLDATYNVDAFEPLLKSLKKELKAMNNSEAKAFVDAVTAHHHKYRLHEWTKKHSDVEDKDWDKLVASRNFSKAADAEIAQAMKRGFGVVETSHMIHCRIDTAVKALERNKVFHFDNHNISYAFVSFYNFIEYSDARSYTFKNASAFLEQVLSSTMTRPTDVLPALESLYLQYLKLESEDAKSVVKNILYTQHLVYRHWDPTDMFYQNLISYRLKGGAKEQDETYAIMGKAAYVQASDETRAAIRAAFPELIEYFEKRGTIEKFDNKSMKNSI